MSRQDSKYWRARACQVGHFWWGQENIESWRIKLARFEDIVLSINATTAKDKVAFSLVKSCKSDDFPNGNCRLARYRLKRKYQPHTAPSLLKLEKQFMNCCIETIEEDPEDWISKLETLRNEIENIPRATKKSDRDFSIHVLNNIPVE